MDRRSVLTFVAVLASASLALNVAGAHPGPPEVRQFVRLAAQAAEVPVPRPLPIDSVDAGSASAPTALVPIAPAPEKFVGPPPVRVAPPARLQSATPVSAGTEPGTWAVVIGINDYPGTQNDLNYAVNDANDAVQALTQQGVTDNHLISLRDGQVTPGVVHSAINWLDSHAGPDAVAVFFYAGHAKKVGSEEAIVTSDGGLVRDKELAAWLKPLVARRAWITIAACYGGGFDEVLAPGRVLTGAAGPNDVAYESSAFGRSYLAEYMIHQAMIEGAASDTVQTAYTWARAAISQQYPGREPVQYDDGDGALNLRPAAQASAQSTSAPASAPPSAPAPDQSSAPPPPDPSQPPDPNSAPPDPNSGSGDPPPRQCKGLVRIC